MEQQKIIEFQASDFEAAWENTPTLVNKKAAEFRLCYICKYHLQKNLAEHLLMNHDGFNWTLDLINAKKPFLQPDNYIAVHLNCVPNRRSLDSRKQIKRVLKTPWKFDESWIEDNSVIDTTKN
ncbi:hypothetical protein JN01_0311 [Entomoplasma freundtii]|uniref:Uncharacterized protein n=2 Tax=Entomoplasma freundtii TaxID=74700 RepID=A0A2K8NRV3_9MOLU|nr:hypothetical protein [Entomoplasma freundtii]ATZ16276.1 hypothetical protein EFREU_v1c02490 [Entomoplasma freundtii]TDY56823.1 hypothetical protein JN01_0311 [Entomoplasma freundtii]